MCGDIHTGTYDVQGVAVEVVGTGAVRVSCSFISNSMARGCRVTVCPSGQTDISLCSSVTSSRSSGDRAVADFTGLAEGTYFIGLVEDEEAESVFTEIADLSVFNLAPFNVSGPDGSNTADLSTSILTPNPGGWDIAHTSCTQLHMTICCTCM